MSESEMNDVEFLKTLSHWELVRMIMNRIWNRFDTGGISYERSLRSDLLEKITGITNAGYHIYLEVDVDDLYKEALIRNHDFEISQKLLPLGLNGLPLYYYACFVVREIKRWYETNKIEDMYAPSERRNVEKLAESMRIDLYLKQFDLQGITHSVQEILEEGRERQYTLNMWESGHYL